MMEQHFLFNGPHEILGAAYLCGFRLKPPPLFSRSQPSPHNVCGLLQLVQLLEDANTPGRFIPSPPVASVVVSS